MVISSSALLVRDALVEMNRGFWTLSLLLSGLAAFFGYAVNHRETFLGNIAEVHATISVPPVTLSVGGTGEDSFYRMTFQAELVDERDKERLKERMPRVQETIIRYLADMKPTQLARGSAGMEKTKRDLVGRLNAALPDTPVRALYFTEFVEY